MKVTALGDGVYRVETERRTHTVYAVTAGDVQWAFIEGRVYREASGRPERTRAPRAKGDAAQSLTAPMPASVLKVLVAPGALVRKGDVVIVLEAMKMELPIRAPADGRVKAVHCEQGQMVAPDTVLVQLE